MDSGLYIRHTKKTTKNMKTTEDLNKEIDSRCDVKLLTQDEAVEAMMRPIIAANREQQTKERHVRFLDMCNNVRKQNQQMRELKKNQ